jgi:hypothetical protein
MLGGEEERRLLEHDVGDGDAEEGADDLGPDRKPGPYAREGR